MMKKFLSLIAAFTLSTLAASAADVWKMYTIQDRYNPTTSKTYTKDTPVVPGNTVTFVIEILNKGSAYNTTAAEGALPDTKGTSWGFVNTGTGFDAAYPTISVSVGGRRDEASIVGVYTAASSGYATALICEYVAKPGDLARPLKIWNNEFIDTPTIGGTTIGIKKDDGSIDTPAWGDGWVEPVKSGSQGAKTEGFAEYNSAERTNRTLAGSNIYIEGARFATAAPETNSAAGTWLSVRANSTELFGGEAAIVVNGASVSDGASTLYIWSGNEDVVEIVGDSNVLKLAEVDPNAEVIYNPSDKLSDKKTAKVYELVFSQGTCRFKLHAKDGTYDADDRKTAKIYVSTKPGMHLNNATTIVNDYIEATVDVIAPSRPSVWVRLDGAYKRAVTIGSASQPKMTVSLSGRSFDEKVTVKLAVSYYDENDVAQPQDEADPEYLVIGAESVKETRLPGNLTYTFEPGETEKEVYYFLMGAPKGENIMITPTCVSTDKNGKPHIAADDCHEACMVATPDPKIVSVEANGFQSGLAHKGVTVTISDSYRNLELKDKYQVNWYVNSNDSAAVKDTAFTFNKGTFTITGIKYELPGTYTSRVAVTTPDGVTVSQDIEVVVKERTYAKLVRLDGADFINPIGEDGKTTMFKIVLEPNPGHSGALYAFFKATKHPELIDDAGSPYASAGHSGLLIKDGETDPFAIKFKDNGVNEIDGEPVIETVLCKTGMYDGEQLDNTYGTKKTTLVVDNVPAYISQFRIKPAGKTAGAVSAEPVTDATKAYNYEATYKGTIKIVNDDEESMELSAYIADVVKDRESDVLVEWRILHADGEQAAIYYTYSTPVKGWVKCPYAPEFNFVGPRYVEVRALDKDQIKAYDLENDEYYKTFIDSAYYKDDEGNALGRYNTIFEAGDAAFFDNFEGSIPSSRVGFTVSANPSITVSLDKNASASDDGTYMGWYEGKDVRTVNIELGAKVNVSSMKFKVVITSVDGAKTPTKDDFEIVGSDVFNEKTVEIANGKTSTSFQLLAKDGGDSAKYKITVTQEAGYTDTFDSGECSFAIYNKAPILLVQQGIDTMSSIQAQNDLESVVVATAGIPYEITWIIDDVNSDTFDVRWSNSNSAGKPEDPDLENKKWTTTFLTPTKPDGALHRITVSWKDDDETTYHSFSWNVRVDASKSISVYPMGPTDGLVNSGLNNKYNVVDGKGAGVVSVEGYENDAKFADYHRWKVGVVDDVTVLAEGTNHTAAIEMKDDPNSYDSFFYTWLTATRNEGAAGYQIDRYGAPLPGKTGKTRATLPTETNEDGSYSDTIYEAVFSKEWRIEDNCGDINQDGIPDRFVAKYGFGLYADGELVGNDLDDLAEYNDDEDYLPYANEMNAVGAIGVTNSWIDTARAFTAKTEIRGYFEGLNLPDSDKTYGNRELSDLEYEAWVDAGMDPNWTAENPTDPTKADTDGDGLPDGYEYALWYRAHVGYVTLDKNGNRQFRNDAGVFNKTYGKRLVLNADNLPDSVAIFPSEIAAHFDPNVALPDNEKLEVDFDNDGLSDWMEYQLGTNPINWDTDGDGIPDGWEVKMGTNPLNGSDGNAGGSNSDGDAMAYAKAYLLTFKLGEKECFWVVPNLQGGADDLNSVMALKRVNGKDYIEPGTEIIGAVLDGGKPYSVYIPGSDAQATRGLLAVSGSKLKSRKLYFPEGATDIVYDTLPYELMHDQVYNFYGFDPRTAWCVGDNDGLLNTRWKSIPPGTAGDLGLPSYGKASAQTRQYTALNEYGLAFYKLHTSGAKVDTNSLVMSLVGLSTDPTSADTDADGMPDGWELYVGLNPKSSGDNTDFDQDYDEDGITCAEEFFGTDSCAAYANCPTIAGKANPVWLNKHWPTDPYDNDTDGDGILDGEEGSTFAYTSDSDDGRRILFRGGGLNPNTVDTDLDGLPDGWEAHFNGVAIEVIGGTFNIVHNLSPLTEDLKEAYYPTSNQIGDGLVGGHRMVRTDGTALAEGTRYVVCGMDGTFAGDAGTPVDPLHPVTSDYDPVTGTVRDFDFDHDGLENYQEYMTQAIRGFRYDDVETPLMGRAIVWKGDTNGEYSPVPNIALTYAIDLASADPKLVFPTFNYFDEQTFLSSMNASVTDPETNETKTEPGPLLKKINTDANAYMKKLVPTSTVTCMISKKATAVTPYTKEDWVAWDIREENGQLLPPISVDLINEQPADSIYTVEWKPYDDKKGWVLNRVLRTGPNTQNITLPGGYDYAKMGYFAFPKQTWDMAANTTRFGNAQNLRRMKYMFAPQTLTRYYTDSTVEYNEDQEDGTTLGFGGKRLMAKSYVSTDPRNHDTDGDGMDDYYELFHGLNPILGATDIIASEYSYQIRANENLWTLAYEGVGDDGNQHPIENGILYDPIKYPWSNGYSECDTDGDGLRNFDESIVANMAAPTTYHTDPTPAWMTDSKGILSYTRQYYSMMLNLPFFTSKLDGNKEVYIWPHVGYQHDGYSYVDKPSGYFFSFEQNEGFDTDGDYVGDSTEIVKSTMPTSDPLDFTDPVRRQAMYFPGADSAMMALNSSFVNSLEFLQTFTVECWINPDVVDKEQVVLERASWYEAARLGDTGHYRANFRIGLDADGRVYGLFDNDDSVESASDVTHTTQIITGPKLVAGNWTHVAVTFDGTDLKLYTDGELKKTVPTAKLIPATGVLYIMKDPASSRYPQGTYNLSTGAFVLGATMTDGWHEKEGKTFDSLAKYYKGYVDEVRIWDGARSATDIKLNYNVRFSKDDIAALRDSVYAAWRGGASRNDNDGRETLPAELKINWGFDTIPAAADPKWVAKEPAGFESAVVDKVTYNGKHVPAEYFDVSSYVNTYSNVLSTVFLTDEGRRATIPFARNTVQQLPGLAGTYEDTFFWSDIFSGHIPAAANGVESYTIPNSMNPYANSIILGNRVLPYWRLNRFATASGNSLIQELSYKYRFETTHMFSASTELYPLGGAYAKLAPKMWDNQGPSDAWVDTDNGDKVIPAKLAWNVDEAVLAEVPEWYLTSKGQEYVENTSADDIVAGYNAYVAERNFAAVKKAEAATIPLKFAWDMNAELVAAIENGEIPQWWILWKGQEYAESASKLQATIDYKNENILPKMPQWFVKAEVRAIMVANADEVVAGTVPEWWLVRKGRDYCAVATADVVLADYAADVEGGLLAPVPDTAKTIPSEITWNLKPGVIDAVPEWWLAVHDKSYIESLDADTALAQYEGESIEYTEAEKSLKLPTAITWNIDSELPNVVPEWWIFWKGQTYAENTSVESAKADYDFNVAHGLLDTPDMTATIPALTWEVNEVLFEIVPEWWLVYKGFDYAKAVSGATAKARADYLHDLEHGILANPEVDKFATIITDEYAWDIAEEVKALFGFGEAEVPEWFFLMLGRDYTEAVDAETALDNYKSYMQTAKAVIAEPTAKLSTEKLWKVDPAVLAVVPEWWLASKDKTAAEAYTVETATIAFKNDTTVRTPHWKIPANTVSALTTLGLPEWWLEWKGEAYVRTTAIPAMFTAYGNDTPKCYDITAKLPRTKWTVKEGVQALLDAGTIPEWWLAHHDQSYVESVGAETALEHYNLDVENGILFDASIDKTAELPEKIAINLDKDLLDLIENGTIPEWWLEPMPIEDMQQLTAASAFAQYNEVKDDLIVYDPSTKIPVKWNVASNVFDAVPEWWLVYKGQYYAEHVDKQKADIDYAHDQHEGYLVDVDRTATIIEETSYAGFDTTATLPSGKWTLAEAIENAVEDGTIPEWWLVFKGREYTEALEVISIAVADYEAYRDRMNLGELEQVLAWKVDPVALEEVPEWWLVYKGQDYVENTSTEEIIADYNAMYPDEAIKLPTEPAWSIKPEVSITVPEWWLAVKGKKYAESVTIAQAIEDYLRDIAAGMQPDGSVNSDYAATSDANTNGIPDWWESLYGLDGKTYDTDKDGLPDYIEYYVSEILAKNLGLKNLVLDPTNQMSDGLTLDYFLKLGDLYLGEVFTDHDQMDDVWENDYDMAKVSRYVYDPNNDPDKDGWSNYAEFRAKTDPTLFASTGFMGIQNAEYPIPSIEFTVSTDADIADDAKFIVQAKRSVLSHEEDDGGYDATWYVGMSTNVMEVIDFTHTWSKSSGSSSESEEKPYTKLMGRNASGTRTYHLTPGSITPGSVKIYVYDPNFRVVNRTTGETLYYVGVVEWQAVIQDAVAEGDTGDLIFSTYDRKIGTIDYKTGTVTIDYSVMPLSVNLAFNLVNGDHTNDKGESTYTYLDIGNCYFGIEWKAQPVNGGRYNTYYLNEPEIGHIREGKNDFIAFLDEDGDGKYTIGELFGAVNGVDVGWDSAKLSIKLTKTNPLFPRYDIMSGENDRDYWYGTPATENTTTTDDGTKVTYTPDAATLNGRLVRVRVIRHSTDIGALSKDKQVAIFDKYLNIDKRGYLHEGDILKSGEYDLDWTAAKDIFSGSIDFGQINYVVVVGENGEYTNTTKIARHYDTKAAGGRAAAMNLKDVHCYGARPSFCWMMRPARDSNLEFNTYTAFSIKILSGSDVVYNSGCQKMPPVDQDGYCNWTAPISFGDIVRGDKKYSVLPYSGDFTWRIAIYNSKFQDDSVYAEGKLSASVEHEGKFVEGHGYGSLDVTLKYAGPASLLNNVGTVTGGLPKGQIRVEAFETPDFSGDAVASAFAKKVDGELKAMVCGLEIGKAYYLRAYLDSDGDQQKSDWESWGSTTAPLSVTANLASTLIYIEDCDTDQDWLPDAWEYAKSSNLTTLGGNNEKKLTAAEGLWSLQLQGSISLDKTTQQKLLVAPSSDTFVTESFASLLLGTPIDISDDGAIRGKIEDGSLVITGFKVENGKVKIDLDATVSSVLNTALAKLYKVAENLKVKVVVLHTESLNGDWTEIGSKSDMTFGKEAQSIEIDLDETTPANGFYKVTIAQ